MAYTIYNTDGSILLTLGEGKVDQKTTSLSLIGKNVNAYGEYLNNNLVRLLGHFASTDEPRSPIVGQLWYDTTAGRMKVYDLNNVFRPITNTLAADTKPVELANNDLWFDTVNEQLYFSTNGQNTLLIGPKDSKSYGNTGWIADIIEANDGTDYTVNKLYNNNQLVAILSTSSFTFAANTGGMFSASVGLNLNPTIGNIKFHGTATSADAIAGISVNQFLRKDINDSTLGSLSIVNDQGLIVSNSVDDQVTISITSGTHIATLAYNETDEDLRIQVTNGEYGSTSTFYMRAVDRTLGIWTESPQYPVDIFGNTRIVGDLIVQGSSTSVTSVSLQVYDKNIELGHTINTDVGVNGGGITLKGTTDHTLTWSTATGWEANDNFNITSTSSFYKISGTNVLTYNSLGLGIQTALGMKRMGVLEVLTVTNVSITGNTITTIGTNQTLYLDATGLGTIDVSSNKITNLATPAADSDASTKKYVDDTLFLVKLGSFSLSLDVSNFVGAYGSVDNGVKNWLDEMFPVTNIAGDELFDLPNGARCKVLCATTSIVTSSTGVTVTTTPILVDAGGWQFTATVASGLAGATVGQLASQTYTPTTVYTVQTWKVQTGVWTKIS
jgi:hypothetical protein